MAIYLSTSVTLVIFVAIILYHILRQLQLTKFGSKMKAKFFNALPALLKSYVAQNEPNGEFLVETRLSNELSYQSGSCAESASQATPQGGYTESYNSYELKEPLLENQYESYPFHKQGSMLMNN